MARVEYTVGAGDLAGVDDATLAKLKVGQQLWVVMQPQPPPSTDADASTQPAASGRVLAFEDGTRVCAVPAAAAAGCAQQQAFTVKSIKRKPETGLVVQIQIRPSQARQGAAKQLGGPGVGCGGATSGALVSRRAAPPS